MRATITRIADIKCDDAMPTITLPEGPTQLLDVETLAALVYATLRATAAALHDDSVSLTEWLVFRPEGQNGYRSERVSGPQYRGATAYHSIEKHWRTDEANLLLDYLWDNGAWKKTLTRDDNQVPTKDAWKRFAWGDLIHGPLIHLVEHAAVRQLVAAPIFDPWSLDDSEISAASTDVAAMVCNLPRRVVALCPILGLNMGDTSQIHFTSGVALKKWIPTDRCEFLTLHHEQYLHGDFSGTFSDAYLRFEVDIPKTDRHSAETTVATLLDRVKWALQVASGQPYTFIESPTIIETASGWRGATLRRTGGPPTSWRITSVDGDLANKASSFLTLLAATRKVTTRVDAAIWLFGRCCNSTLARDGLIDAATGMEALLVPNSGDSRYRFTLHGLALLHSVGGPSLEDDLREIYRVRSVIAHGGDIDDSAEELAKRARMLLASLVAVVCDLIDKGELVISKQRDVASSVEQLVKNRACR